MDSWRQMGKETLQGQWDSNDREYSTLERIMMSVLIVIKAVKKKKKQSSTWEHTLHYPVSDTTLLEHTHVESYLIIMLPY